MQFLYDKELDKAIRCLTKGPRVKCAVAFWGQGAIDLFDGLNQQDVRIICNLRSGGTNPYVIENLKKLGADVRQFDQLHAKVYIGNDYAIVTSANASANGLGLEGGEQLRWNEAGAKLTEISTINEWFEAFWLRSREIDRSDIRNAIEKWKKRQFNRPSLISFGDFNVYSDMLPLLNWEGNGRDWTALENNIERQLGYYDESIQDRLDRGLVVEAPEDEALMKPGTWVLTWQRNSNGYPNRRIRPWWVCLGPLVRDAFLFNDEINVSQDAVLEHETPPPEPFNLADPLFLTVFHEIIAKSEYDDLRDDDYEGPWFTSRQQSTRRFWHDLKDTYLRLAERC